MAALASFYIHGYSKYKLSETVCTINYLTKHKAGSPGMRSQCSTRRWSLFNKQHKLFSKSNPSVMAIL